VERYNEVKLAGSVEIIATISELGGWQRPRARDTHLRNVWWLLVLRSLRVLGLILVVLRNFLRVVCIVSEGLPEPTLRFE
jgi:hypothetical protein